MRIGRRNRIVLTVGAALASAAIAAPPTAPPPADLADQAQGRYVGDVISDARGSAQSDVRITVSKIGPNKVQVSSDYARLPLFQASLGRYMDTIQDKGGDQVFLLDLSKKPATLNVTVDDASWAGVRE